MEKGLLYYMNGNLQMGKTATKHLIEISNDEKMRASLLDDLHAYEKFENAVLNRMGGDDVIKPLSNMAVRNTEMAIDMKTFVNDSRDKMADMLAKGYEKGIRSIHSNLQKLTEEPEDVKELATGYLNFMKQTHAKYKGFE